MKIIISSFGYKFGTPIDADLLLDARALRNPFRSHVLRQKDGRSDEVWKFVTSDPRWKKWKECALFCVNETLFNAEYKGQSQVLIGIGCTGGRHRSVVATLELARYFHWHDSGGASSLGWGKYDIQVGHRDVNREGKHMGKLRSIKEVLAGIPHLSKKTTPW